MLVIHFLLHSFFLDIKKLTTVQQKLIEESLKFSNQVTRP